MIQRWLGLVGPVICWAVAASMKREKQILVSLRVFLVILVGFYMGNFINADGSACINPSLISERSHDP